MPPYHTLEQIDEAVQAVRSHITQRPKIGLILGSGLGPLADAFEDVETVSYRDIPHWPVSTVEGHQGQLVAGCLEGKSVLTMQGRVHFYEGCSMAQVGFPIRAMNRFGVGTLIITTACGAVNPEYTPGDLMLIIDHLNLMGMAGTNPLFGPNLDEFGVRFPDMNQAYDHNLLALAREAAADAQIPIHEGIHICVAGPSFETPADLRFLRTIGADAVSMSTTPEVITARHSGIRVLGVSGISNKANLDGSTITAHEEVLAAGRILVPRLTSLVRGVLQRL